MQVGYDILLKSKVKQKSFYEFETEIIFFSLKRFPYIWYFFEKSQYKWKYVIICKENLYKWSHLCVFFPLRFHICNLFYLLNLNPGLTKNSHCIFKWLYLAPWISQGILLTYLAACFLRINLILRASCMTMWSFIPSAVNNYSDFYE